MVFSSLFFFWIVSSIVLFFFKRSGFTLCQVWKRIFPLSDFLLPYDNTLRIYRITTYYELIGANKHPDGNYLRLGTVRVRYCVVVVNLLVVVTQTIFLGHPM